MSLQKNLENKLKTAIVDVTPGVCVQAFVGGKKKIDLRVGDTYRFYDWASLTKIVSTVSQLMRHFEQGKFTPDTKLNALLPWMAHAETPIRDLLTHTAGFPWWMPLYKDIHPSLSIPERRFELRRRLREMKAETREKAVYSDIDFWFLGEIVEALSSRPIDFEFSNFAQLLGLQGTRFHRENIAPHKKSEYAPTENCEWRGRVIQGEVHDENTWALGGVAGHAGLFGPMDDLAKWGLELRRSLQGESRLWSAKTARLFTTRAIPSEKGDWALGFMMPTPGAASCGKYFSEKSIGHTGFTGTSLWFDPKKDFLVVILSNRVHPTRKNEKFRTLRPQIHDWCYEACFS